MNQRIYFFTPTPQPSRNQFDEKPQLCWLGALQTHGPLSGAHSFFRSSQSSPPSVAHQFLRAPNPGPRSPPTETISSMSSYFLLSGPLSKWHHLHRNKREVIRSHSLSFLHPPEQPHARSYLLPGSVEEGCTSSCPKVTLNQSSKTHHLAPLLRDLPIPDPAPPTHLHLPFSSGFSSTAHTR